MIFIITLELFVVFLAMWALILAVLARIDALERELKPKLPSKDDTMGSTPTIYLGQESAD